MQVILSSTVHYKDKSPNYLPMCGESRDPKSYISLVSHMENVVREIAERATNHLVDRVIFHINISDNVGNIHGDSNFQELLVSEDIGENIAAIGDTMRKAWDDFNRINRKPVLVHLSGVTGGLLEEMSGVLVHYTSKESNGRLMFRGLGDKLYQTPSESADEFRARCVNSYLSATETLKFLRIIDDIRKRIISIDQANILVDGAIFKEGSRYEKHN